MKKILRTIVLIQVLVLVEFVALTGCATSDKKNTNVTPPKILKQHTGIVTNLAYSPGGTTLASASDDSTIKLWNANTRELKYTLTGHTGTITEIVYSPDGNIFASASYDKTIKFWNANTGELKHTLTGVRNITYSPDGNTLASSSDDGTVKLWDANTKKLKHTLTGHADYVTDIAYSPDGNTLVSSSDDGTVKLWGVNTRKLKHTLTGHTDYVTDIAYSPDGNTLASTASTSNDNIKIWNVKTGDLKYTLTGHIEIVYSPDGNTLASVSDDNTIQLWNPDTGKVKYSLIGHIDNITTLKYLPDRNILASASDKTIKLWDTETGDLIVNLRHADSAKAIAYSEYMQTLAVANGSDVRLWDIRDTQLKQLMFSELKELPERIKQIEENVLKQLDEVKDNIRKSDYEFLKLSEYTDDIDKEQLEKIFRELHRLEEKGDINEILELQTNTSKLTDSMIQKILTERINKGIELLKQQTKLTNSELPKLHEQAVNKPILQRRIIRKDVEVLEASLKPQLDNLMIKLLYRQRYMLTAFCSESKLHMKINISDAIQRLRSTINLDKAENMLLAQATQPLPHNGLFNRRNNCFGTKLTSGIKELIEHGVMIEQRKIRFDDFIAMNTEGIPLPASNHALAVSHGISAIPLQQKRYEKTTHYLEIALKASKAVPIGHPQTKAPAVNYIFVIDKSSSMSGEKLETVKSSIQKLFEQLRKDDVIGIVAFDDQPKTLLKANLFKDINASDFGEIINNLNADGGTDINLGLSFGIDEISRYDDGQRLNQIFLFSDGNPTSGETNWINIHQSITAKIRNSNLDLSIFSFAYGTDANRRELDKLAGLTGGHYA
ncbi:MAG: VWA domain-containing protein [Desulfobacterales bacterium]|nr:VWA domain-containing protein [Desulfobacterales bacterium]